MSVQINKDGKITITTETSLSNSNAKKLIIKVATNNGYYRGNEGHDRWTALYNAYDMMYDTDIRGEHVKYEMKHWAMSRIDFLVKTNQIDRLLYVASRLYKKEMEEYISGFVVVC